MVRVVPTKIQGLKVFTLSVREIPILYAGHYAIDQPVFGTAVIPILWTSTSSVMNSEVRGVTSGKHEQEPRHPT